MNNVQIRWEGGYEEAGCSDFGPGNNPNTQKSYNYSEAKVVNVQILRWVGGSGKISTLLRFVNLYRLLDDP